MNSLIVKSPNSLLVATVFQRNKTLRLRYKNKQAPPVPSQFLVHHVKLKCTFVTFQRGWFEVKVNNPISAMPESSSILKSLVVVGATAAATLSAFGLYWIIERSTTETKTRRASYRCSCGEVEASIIIPAANYRYSEIPSFQCACCDCVGFCERVSERLNFSAQCKVNTEVTHSSLLLFASSWLGSRIWICQAW